MTAISEILVDTYTKSSFTMTLLFAVTVSVFHIYTTGKVTTTFPVIRPSVVGYVYTKSVSQFVTVRSVTFLLVDTDVI